MQATGRPRHAARTALLAAKVTVTGRVVRRGRAPVLAATVEVLRGSRVLRRRSVTPRGRAVTSGRFSLRS